MADKAGLKVAADKVAAWLKGYVGRDNWNDFVAEVKAADLVCGLSEDVKKYGQFFGFDELFENHYRRVELLDPDDTYRPEALIKRCVNCLTAAYPHPDDISDVLTEGLRLAWKSTEPVSWQQAIMIGRGSGGYISE